MPTFALHPFEQEYHLAPRDRLTALTPILSAEIDDPPMRPYVFLDPGRPFSFVSHSVAQFLPWRQRPVARDPVPTFMMPAGLLTPVQLPSVARDELLTAEGVPCEFGEADLRFTDADGRTSAPLRLFARFASAPVPAFGDFLVLLGASFLIDNHAELFAHGVNGSLAGRLTVP